MRTEPFVNAGLTGQGVDYGDAVVPRISYEVRGVGETSGRSLLHDPSAPLEPQLARLFAHGVATFVVVLAAGLTMIGMAPRLFGYESVVVTSGSMEPSIQIADVVVTAPAGDEQLGTGAVINFERGDGTVLHRITEIAETGYRTTGDANRVADSEIVRPEDIRGIGIVVVPLVGLPSRWADQGKWFHLATTAVVLVAAMHMSRQSWAWPRRKRWVS